jgi:hypothetical protein
LGVINRLRFVEGKVRTKSAPTGFVKQRWAAQVMPGGTIDRRYYELWDANGYQKPRHHVPPQFVGAERMRDAAPKTGRRLQPRAQIQRGDAVGAKPVRHHRHDQQQRQPTQRQTDEQRDARGAGR